MKARLDVRDTSEEKLERQRCGNNERNDRTEEETPKSNVKGRSTTTLLLSKVA